MEYGNDVLAKTEKVFKGNNISETTFIAQEWNSCDESFYFGEKYLVFGNEVYGVSQEAVAICEEEGIVCF